MFQRILYLGKNSFALWSKKRAASRGAAIAFYTVTSIAPIILLVIAIAGLIFGAAAARGAVFGQLSGLLGATSADAADRHCGCSRQRAAASRRR